MFPKRFVVLILRKRDSVTPSIKVIILIGSNQCRSFLFSKNVLDDIVPLFSLRFQ